jgi:COP9 signalosome complex subunit 8
MLMFRMPPTLVKDDPVLQNSLLLLHAVWQNKYRRVYRILRERSWPHPVNEIVRKYECECLS